VSVYVQKPGRTGLTLIGEMIEWNWQDFYTMNLFKTGLPFKARFLYSRTVTIRFTPPISIGVCREIKEYGLGYNVNENSKKMNKNCCRSLQGKRPKHR
jgi:hypothetical protein